MEPTQAGFLAWVRAFMGIGTAALPDDAPAIGYAYAVATELVPCELQAISPTMYMLAVYNLGGDNLINYAPDQAGQTFFADARKLYRCNDFVMGVVASTGDNGTSTSLAVPDALRELTLAQLQNMKTPYGRRYMSIVQSLGPTIWGIS
jgi:hypothetical protein